MIYELRRVLGSQDTFGQLLLACALGLILGGGLVLASPTLVFVGMVALVGGIIVVQRPEIAMLAMLIAYSTVVNVNVLPLIPIGVGSLNILDATLIGLLGLIVVRWMVEPDFRLRRTPMDLPLLVFYGAAALATVIAIMRSSVDFTMAVREMRYITYYIAFFVVTNLVREKPQLDFLIKGFFILAGVTAIMMIVQAVIGYATPIVYGRVEEFAQAGSRVEGISRIIPAGRYLILIAFNCYTLRAMLHWPVKLLEFCYWLLLLAALILTFNRNFWVISALVVVLFFILATPAIRRNVVKFSLVISLIGALSIAALPLAGNSTFGQVLSSAAERVLSIFDTRTYQGRFQGDPVASSLDFRKLENQYILPQIVPPPLLGSGMGARYRPTDPRLDYERYDGRAYVHNAHFWLILKAGLVSYLALMLTMLLLIVRGVRYWRAMPTAKYQAIMLGFSLSAIGLLFSAIVDPLLTDLSWSPVCAVILGVNEVLIHMYGQQEKQQ